MKAVALTEDSNHTGVDRFLGYSIYETGGSSAMIVTFRKLSVSGAILAVVTVAAGGSASLNFSRAMSSEGGVYVQVTGAGGVCGGVLYDNG